MKPFKNEDYRYCWINDDGWVVGLWDVAFGTRVIIYHKNDNFSIDVSLCAGNKPIIIANTFLQLFEWLNTNPDNVRAMCYKLSKLEKRRPIPASPRLVEALKDLPKEEANIDFDLTEFVFKPSTILPFLKNGR